MNANKDCSAVSSANMEQNISNESLAEKETQGLDSRFNIVITSYRKRKHDPDGISVKAVLDGLVRRGILTDDSTSEINKITFTSKICRKGEKEQTVIELEKFNQSL